jgi:RND family efflux transporter MFP subunit
MWLSRGVLLLSLLSLPALLQAEALRARLEWAHIAELRAFESGIVGEVLVLEGQHVKQNQSLLTLDSRDFDIAVRAASAQLKAAQARHDKAQREHGWESELYDRGLISDNELNNAVVALSLAESEVETAQAALENAQLALERSVIRAPFDGVVVAVRAWDGQALLKTLQSEALIELAQGSKMVARTRIAADAVDEYRSGQPARVKLDGQWRDGVIYRIGTVSEGVLEQGIAYAVDILFELGEDEVLRPGQFCMVEFE